MDDFEKAKRCFAEGMQSLQANDLQTAETQFTRALEIVPNRVSTLNNLAAVKIRRQKFAEAEELALKAIKAGDNSPEIWSNLGIAQAAANCDAAALQSFARALDSNPAYLQAWLHKAISLFKLKQYDEALLACDRALILDSSQYMLFYVKSMALKELGRLDEAEKVYLQSIRMRMDLSPVFAAERRPTQKADILIISHNPSRNDLFKSFELLHANCLNYPSQLSKLFPDDYRFTFAIERIATRPSARRQIPLPDIVINNCANGAILLAEGRMSELVAFVDGFGVPVVNHPSQAIHTIRDVSAKLLAGAPGIVVPKTVLFTSGAKTSGELVKEIEGQFDYPLITRNLSSQDGVGMTKVDSRGALLEVFASGLPEKFFVTQFLDSKGQNKFYRKIRAAFVKDEIIITRVDYKDHWNVHGRKAKDRVPFYLANIYLLDEEKRICKDPEAALGRAAVQALRTIRDRIPLDIFGLDFDVDANGVLIFYEANATMNLLSTAQREVPNPEEPNNRLKQVFRNYLDSLLARS